MFSSRTPRDLTMNAVSEALAARRRAGLPVIDLTMTNPTTAGFEYPSDLLHPLGEPAGLIYSPDPIGLEDARQAVAADYGRRGVTVDPSRLALTASTSEAYSMLFKILCDAGDRVLVPRPSYPLFDHLAALDGVVAVPYDLEYDGRWLIDRASVERAWSARTRAVLCVHPNNPTGSVVTRDEFEWLAQWSAPRQSAVIVDEVFADYVFDDAAALERADVLSEKTARVFSLGGLSKTIGLPQAKLAWIAVGGEDAFAREAMDRLAFACDTYLSVSTPVQRSAARLLERGALVRHQIRERVARNRRSLRDASLSEHGCTLLAADGGWAAVLHVPSLESEETLVLRLLTERGVLVHPGYFYDFARESYIVLSLVSPEPTFDAGVSAVLDHVAARSRAPHLERR